MDTRTGQLVLMSAIDNLIKGQAGQGVQCLNLMAGLVGDGRPAVVLPRRQCSAQPVPWAEQVFLLPTGRAWRGHPHREQEQRPGPDRTGIQLLGDDVHRAAGDFHPGLQGLPDGIQATEAGQQEGWMLIRQRNSR